MLEHSCKKHCIAPTWICAMGLVLELWDNFEFFADVPTIGIAIGKAKGRDQSQTTEAESESETV